MFDLMSQWISAPICGLASPILPSVFANSCVRYFDGFWQTIILLILSVSAGFVLAMATALARLSQRKFLANVAAVYSYVFRGTPLLVQLFIAYYGIGSFGEEGLGSLLWLIFGNGWTVGLIILSLNTGAYSAEIIRGAVVNLPPGQMEAAKASGMSWLLAMYRIILPQAFRYCLPAYANEVVLLMKGSALVSTIAVMDLMGQTRTIYARSYQLEVYVNAAIMYLVIAGLITWLFRSLEKRLKVG
ncbi:MAG: ABC transporter permease subunit [Candidatus Pacebacteria bacterium]|nr:ABC transporter permease subunit [Candidatus Paceibacterota bacterium]